MAESCSGQENLAMEYYEHGGSCCYHALSLSLWQGLELGKNKRHV
jgi:hypothetical protein